MTAAPTAPTSKGLSSVVLGLSLMVVAANLRPTLTALGPVLGLIRTDTGLAPAALGLLGAVPLLAFAGVSPLVQLISRRWGADHTVFAATVVMVVATVVRSLPGSTATLWAGTVALGAGIAVCNVLVPALVKRDFPDEVPLMTGVYTAVLSGSAALASGLSLPIAQVSDWRVGLGAWVVVGVLALVAWWPRLRHHRPDPALPLPSPLATPAGTTASRSVWRSALAWQVTAFMGTQAIYFYLVATWLPSIRIARGVGPVAAGWELSGFQAAGIVGGLLVGFLMRGSRDHRLVAAGVSVGMMVGVLGLLLLPGLGLLWIVVGGLSSGASLVVALSFVAERSRTTADAARLSGMAQSIGYLLAIIGPIGAGALYEATGGWTSTLVAATFVTGLQLVASLFAGRDAYVQG